MPVAFSLCTIKARLLKLSKTKPVFFQYSIKRSLGDIIVYSVPLNNPLLKCVYSIRFVTTVFQFEITLPVDPMMLY